MNKIKNSWVVHSMIIDGYHAAQLPADHCPDAWEISDRLFATTWRRLTNASNPYLSDPDWYAPLYDKHFPATNYIRTMEDLEFTPLPDLAHDYFGHMPLMFHPRSSQLQWILADMYQHATDIETQDLYNLARYVIEYSVIKEDWIPKIYGAWLLSSPGDFESFVNHRFMLVPADLQTICTTDRSPHHPHTTLFVFESFQQMRDIVMWYREQMSFFRSK
jgi:phenylalanine-4-hydroxylase